MFYKNVKILPNALVLLTNAATSRINKHVPPTEMVLRARNAISLCVISAATPSRPPLLCILHDLVQQHSKNRTNLDTYRRATPKHIEKHISGAHKHIHAYEMNTKT